MSWLYKDQVIENISQIPEGVIGFVYRITNTETEQWYIGKKFLYTTRRLPPLKGFKRKRKVTKESDWLSYRSSSEIVKNWQSISKRILVYAYSKKDLTYLETKYLFKEEALEDHNCMNSNILGKFFR